MILFPFKSHCGIGAVIANAIPLTWGRFHAARFDNGELRIEIETPVKREDCYILGSIAPPDEQMLSALLLARTLKKEGARTATAIFPYLAYTRQDKDKPGESLATAWVGSIAQASGIDSVITIDAHSERGRKLFPIPVISLSPAELFAAALHRFHLMDAAIVAPDEGAISRCQAVRRTAGLPEREIPYFEKRRTAAGIVHATRIASVGPRAVIVDDMLDTGSTVISACQRLREVGVEEIHVMVTHGLFTGERWKELWQLGVKRIFCTDSIPGATPAQEGAIECLPVAPLLVRELSSHGVAGDSNLAMGKIPA